MIVGLYALSAWHCLYLCGAAEMSCCNLLSQCCHHCCHCAEIRDLLMRCCDRNDELPWENGPMLHAISIELIFQAAAQLPDSH